MKTRRKLKLDKEFLPQEMNIDMFGGKAPCGHCMLLPTCLNTCELCDEWKKKYYKRRK